MSQEKYYEEMKKEESRYKKQRRKYELGAIALIPIFIVWMYVLVNASKYGISNYILYILIGGLAFFSIVTGTLEKMKRQNISRYNRIMQEIERISLENRLK